MYKLIAIYVRPEDPAHFRKHLVETHLPLVARFPGLQAMHYSVAIDAGEDDQPFAVVECEFADEKALRDALSSPEGEAAGADVPNYAAAGVSILTYEPRTFALTPFPGG
ncbi:EthD family reductase [Paraburkholderia fungorum]|jgi:uncharacterized protein (TIGR02118 family)|uniref:EthD family reductase n=1 Tax=Paraburkholderia fungorum TaxID=134537 RepID=UPI0038BB39DB